jgi:ribosome assembly protein 1
MCTSSKQSTVIIKCVPLPPDVTNILENNAELIKALDSHTNVKLSDINIESMRKLDLNPSEEESEIGAKIFVETTLGNKTLEAIAKLKSDLTAAFKEAGGWDDDIVDRIWCFGPRRCGPNILINKVEGGRELLLKTVTFELYARLLC